MVQITMQIRVKLLQMEMENDLVECRSFCEVDGSTTAELFDLM